MRTNGCTMAIYVNRQVVTCDTHARMTRDETTAYQKPGAVLARRAAYTAVGPRGVWTKGATWRAVKPDERKALVKALDECAARKVAPCSTSGVLIRRKASK